MIGKRPVVDQGRIISKPLVHLPEAAVDGGHRLVLGLPGQILIGLLGFPDGNVTLHQGCFQIFQAAVQLLGIFSQGNKAVHLLVGNLLPFADLSGKV